MQRQDRPRRRDVLILAGRAGVDPRTAERALREGPDALRGMVGDRILDALDAIEAERRVTGPR
jgi:hypothetical protein